jgi:hypothetical protein
MRPCVIRSIFERRAVLGVQGAKMVEYSEWHQGAPSVNHGILLERISRRKGAPLCALAVVCHQRT